MCVRVCVCVCMCMFVFVCCCASLHVRSVRHDYWQLEHVVCVCVYACLCLSAFVSVCACAHVYVCVCVGVCLHVFVCVRVAVRCYTRSQLDMIVGDLGMLYVGTCLWVCVFVSVCVPESACAPGCMCECVFAARRYTRAQCDLIVGDTCNHMCVWGGSGGGVKRDHSFPRLSS